MLPYYKRENLCEGNSYGLVSLVTKLGQTYARKTQVFRIVGMTNF